MPTKDSQIISLRIRNPIVRNATEQARKQGMALHYWAVKLIEKEANRRDSLLEQKSAPVNK